MHFSRWALLVDNTKNHSHKTPHAGIMNALALAAVATPANRDTEIEKLELAF